jgi:2-succinyl-5-enolpyruvyl-6-hydroxy-3-cyclohexene-1-carboxylate synthase
LARAHGIPHCRVESENEFSQIFGVCVNRGGPEIIEVCTDRQSNAASHQAFIGRVAQASRKALGIE